MASRGSEWWWQWVIVISSGQMACGIVDSKGRVRGRIVITYGVIDVFQICQVQNFHFQKVQKFWE